MVEEVWMACFPGSLGQQGKSRFVLSTTGIIEHSYSALNPLFVDASRCAVLAIYLA